MRKIKLPVSGLEVLVGVRHVRVHSERPVTQLGVSIGNDVGWRRSTEVWVKHAASGKALISSKAVCAPEDNFCRKTGRKLAAVRLLAKMRKTDEFGHACGVSSEAYIWFRNPDDRRAVFKAICPEYFPREAE